MAEAIFAGIVLAICLNWIGRSARVRDGFVRRFSRGTYMRELNKKMEDRLLH